MHHDPGSSYGPMFPDFPGRFSDADTLAELQQMAQEAVELHMEGIGGELPLPSKPEDCAGRRAAPRWRLGDARY
ncbi:type II toxin-antitoxin system HicB family antitoxin [Paraburkholderia sp. CI3]|uniref:type II toxin-antitoxin system HicB family antitoxin n=1 Tax=Paraburkholderia sp. CI3 TaxID=2991060 RepID=UPI003D22C450